MKTIAGLTLVLSVLTAATAPPALALGHLCDGCGCDCGVTKICRPVCEMVEEEITCWDCDCKDVCLPGKSCGCCKAGKSCCCEPQCGKVRTVKRLIKKTVTRKVPKTKWVVEYLCDGCNCPGGSCGVEAGVPVESDASADLAAPMPPGYTSSRRAAVESQASVRKEPKAWRSALVRMTSW